MNRRMILNTIMLGMFIFLFAFKLFPRPWHQIMGVAILLPVLFHVINNRRWFSALHRGRWNRKRRLWTAANLAFLVGVILTVITGILCSDYLHITYGSTLPYTLTWFQGFTNCSLKSCSCLLPAMYSSTGKLFPPGYDMD